ncbi:MAG: zinc-finger domain-containing protein [Sphingomonadaceae bacterium]|nr:zinc-finger domain-containing protein [Sphingomonadaceae bacterium]
MLRTVSLPQDHDIPPPEVLEVFEPLVGCQGAGGAIGHPLVYLRIGDSGFADCGYCDRRFVLRGGAADVTDRDKATVPGQDDDDTAHRAHETAPPAPGILLHLTEAH